MRTAGGALVDALSDGCVSEEHVGHVEVPVGNAGEADAVAIRAHVLLDARNAVRNRLSDEPCTH